MIERNIWQPFCVFLLKISQSLCCVVGPEGAWMNGLKSRVNPTRRELRGRGNCYPFSLNTPVLTSLTSSFLKYGWKRVMWGWEEGEMYLKQENTQINAITTASADRISILMQLQDIRKIWWGVSDSLCARLPEVSLKMSSLIRRAASVFCASELSKLVLAANLSCVPAHCVNHLFYCFIFFWVVKSNTFLPLINELMAGARP